MSSPVCAQPACEPWAAKAISAEGNVEVQRAGKAAWRKVALHDTFCPGDSVRVDMRSRAALLLQNETLLRLDEGTAIRFSKIEPDKPAWLDVLKGAIHFISRTPRSLKLRTPFVNAAIEGTEFVVRVEPDETAIWVFEGQVSASNPLGSLMLASGEAAIAKKDRAPERRIVVKPREAVQWALYYPPIIDYRLEAYPTGPDREAIKAALEHYRKDDLPGAFVALDKVPENERTVRYYDLRAGLLLTVGRVDQARADIDRALKLDPNDATAYALQSVIAVTQNEDEKALELAQKSADLDPQSPTAQIALSYAHQALFDIEKARDSVEGAVNLDPENALAWARLAELELSLGYLDKALAAAQKATDLDPDLARTQTVLGFANLTLINIDEAKTAFQKAIELDPAAPLPRLGFGLTLIRQSELDDGTKEIETAAILDPDNSTIRSYLGKAYFEEKRIELAQTEFAVAKELDPNDPTPWFYDAILKQTINRPVEALHDLQKSIQLNDNRAVYRSRLLLDQDQATRGTSLGRIYDDVSFDQIALVEASRSLSLDPANHSAHRFLSDTYAQLPRHEIARVSELLQAQLLQPINVNPIQPRFAVTDLNIITGTGPAEAAFDEFTPLLERNRLQLLASGIAGNNNTFGDEIVLSGLYDRLSFSFGQFHSETDGFRSNNDLENNLYDVFAQVAVTPKLNFQAEFRHRETEQGDLRLNFDPTTFSRDDRRDVRQNVARLGGRFVPSPQSDVIVSLLYTDRTGDQDVIQPEVKINERADETGYQAEAAYLFRGRRSNFTAGGGTYDIDVKRGVIIDFSPLPCLIGTCDIKSRFEREQDNVYAYANAFFPDKFVWTVGLSYDSFKERKTLEVDRLNPKVGLQWSLTEALRLRLAAFRTLKRPLVVEQTIEPTQIASFNQFFDDTNGTKTKRYGIGLDARLTGNIYGGVEASRRDLKVPFFIGGTATAPVELEDHSEDLYRIYLYWSPDRKWSVSGEYRFEQFKREVEELINDRPTEVETISTPMLVRYFNPSGFFGEVGLTYVRQNVDRLPTSTLPSGRDDFVVMDATVGYRLPKQRGIISMEVRNLLDESFSFQDLNFQSSEPRNPSFIPDRVIVGRVALNF